MNVNTDDKCTSRDHQEILHIRDDVDLDDNDLDHDGSSCPMSDNVANAPNQGQRPSGRSGDKKKLVFLSQQVLNYVKHKKVTTGIEIAQRIQEVYKEQKKIEMDFKNVQRRVYDALNILGALKFVKKDQGRILW